ncbi:MAG TPA: hypothetical protein VG929_11495 [Actinomycetota bacterium]|nr:hypothetical protein [Actinomycetota bacterium]
MDKKTLSTVALVAGGLALVGGIWGIVEKVDGNDPAHIQESFMWVAIDLVLLSIAAVCLALASRER